MVLVSDPEDLNAYVHIYLGSPGTFGDCVDEADLGNHDLDLGIPKQAPE